MPFHSYAGRSCSYVFLPQGIFAPSIRTRFYHIISIVITSLLSIYALFRAPIVSALRSRPGIIWRGGRASSTPLICQLAQHPYAQYHDQQADGDDDEQREGEPAEHHGAGADAGLDAAVAKVLGDGAGRDGGGVLPQHRDQHEDGGDEDDGQRHLRHGPAREGFHLAVGALAVLLLVPAREGGQEEEADEGEDDGDDAARGGERSGQLWQAW